MLAAGANAIVAVAYLVIAAIIARGLSRTRQWRRNPLAVATCAIFLTCGIGHAVHVEHLLFAVGGPPRAAAVIRTVFGEWHQIAIDVVTAAVAVYYLTQRRRYGVLLAGNRMFEDLDDRQRTALEVHDDVIQGIVTARLALDLGDTQEARRGLDAALASSRQVVDRLLEPAIASDRLRGGDLRRRSAATPT